MFLRILRDSLLRQKRRKAVVLAAVALGTAAVTALGGIALDVGDKMSRELKAFGANLVILPAENDPSVRLGAEELSSLRLPAYLRADQIRKVKDNFWKNNILGFAPLLDFRVRVAGRSVLLRGTWFERSVPAGEAPTAGRFLTGIRSLNPHWSVAGNWPDEGGAYAEASPGEEVLMGRTLARSLALRPGDRLRIESAGEGATLSVSGILATGGEEDEALLAPLETVWRLSGLSDRVSRILVSALTTPESAVYERIGKDPRELPPSEFERWSCTPFPSSIAYELERALPGSEVKVIRRVADSEGKILARVTGLLSLVVLMAGLASALTVSSALTAGVLERRLEIGLLKALGAGNSGVVGLLLAEAALLGLSGGLMGAGAGALMARWLALSVFGTPASIRPLLIPLAVFAALAIALAGCVLPARRITRLRPAELLRGL